MEIPDKQKEEKMEEGQIGLDLLDNLESLLSASLEQCGNKDVDMNKVAGAIEECVGCMRIILGYLIFDVEATRREKDQLITLLGDKQ